MALDSAEKRKAVSGILHTFVVGVTPNAAKDAEWRQEAGWGYLIEPAVGEGDNYIPALLARRRRVLGY